MMRGAVCAKNAAITLAAIFLGGCHNVIVIDVGVNRTALAPCMAITAPAQAQAQALELERCGPLEDQRKH
jgi:hypothetical protein